MRENLDKKKIRDVCTTRKTRIDAGALIEELEGPEYNKTSGFFRLFEHLRDNRIVNSLSATNEWFCKQYVIELLSAYRTDKLTVEADEYTEIVLAANGLLRGFDKMTKVTERRLAYANAAWGYNGIVQKAWKNPDSVTRLAGAAENTTVEDLADWLVDQAQKDPSFFSAEKLLAQFCGESSEKLTERTMLPKAVFVNKDIGLPDTLFLPETAPPEEISTKEALPELPETILSSEPGVISNRRQRKLRRQLPFAAATVAILLIAVILIPKGSPPTSPADADVQNKTPETIPAGQTLETGSQYGFDLDGLCYFASADIDAYATGDDADPNNTVGSKEVTLERDADCEYTVRFRVSHVSENDRAASPARVYFELPSIYASQIDITGSFYAENLNPDTTTDTVSFTADDGFYLEYVPGSAYIYNDSIGSHALSDEVMGNGVLIGYDKLNGILPSGDQYGCYITFKVRAVFDVPYSVETRVRRLGDEEWEESVDAAIGEKVEVIILYKNISPVTHNNVVIRAEMPDNLSYVTASVQMGEGTTILHNSNHPDGIQNLNDGSVVGAGINIGNYVPGANAYVVFTAEVVDNSLAIGTTKLNIWGQCGVSVTTLQDNAIVYVLKEDPADKTGETETRTD